MNKWQARSRVCGPARAFTRGARFRAWGTSQAPPLAPASRRRVGTARQRRVGGPGTCHPRPAPSAHRRPAVTLGVQAAIKRISTRSSTGREALLAQVLVGDGTREEVGAVVIRRGDEATARGGRRGDLGQRGGGAGRRHTAQRGEHDRAECGRLRGGGGWWVRVRRGKRVAYVGGRLRGGMRSRQAKSECHLELAASLSLRLLRLDECGVVAACAGWPHTGVEADRPKETCM